MGTPRAQLLRPTRAVVREALFNILGEEVVEARVLDLFAGAGTVGFEALSRGAVHATFVDRDEEALSHVRATAARLGCAGRCRVVRDDALHWVRSHAAELAGASVVFLDAPYRDDAVEEVLRAVAEAAPTLVVCEHHRARVLPDRLGRMAVVRRSRYGLTALSVLRPSGEEVVTGG